MKNKNRSARSNRWLKKHFSDNYVRQAHKNGFRSRAWFKLSSIQKSDNLLKPGMKVIDLGAAPGGWSQYAMTKIGKTGRIIACDLLPMNPIVGVEFLKGNLYNKSVMKLLLECVGDNEIQVVMSDMSPNKCGIPTVDIPRTMYLVELALKICRHVLVPNGSLLVKMFQGEGFNEYLEEVRSLFTKVKIRKPDASQANSREVYIVATGHKLYPIISSESFETGYGLS